MRCREYPGNQSGISGGDSQNDSADSGSPALDAAEVYLQKTQHVLIMCPMSFSHPRLFLPLIVCIADRE